MFRRSPWETWQRIGGCWIYRDQTAGEPNKTKRMSIVLTQYVSWQDQMNIFIHWWEMPLAQFVRVPPIENLAFLTNLILFGQSEIILRGKKTNTKLQAKLYVMEQDHQKWMSSIFTMIDIQVDWWRFNIW